MLLSIYGHFLMKLRTLHLEGEPVDISQSDDRLCICTLLDALLSTVPMADGGITLLEL